MVSVVLLLVGSGLSCVAAPRTTPVGNDAARDFTVLLFSDTHIGAENLNATPPFTKADTLARIESNLHKMQRLVGQPWPQKPILGGLDLGAVAVPRALILLGDVTEGHKDLAAQAEQRDTFGRLFPVQGRRFGERTVPLFAGAGNHDGDPAGPVRRALVARHRRLAEAGHFAANHHAEHYRWPDPGRHAADLEFFFDGRPPAHPRQYDVLSCGEVCWVIRVRGDRLIAAHYLGGGWNPDPAAVFVKSLRPPGAPQKP